MHGNHVVAGDEATWVPGPLAIIRGTQWYGIGLLSLPLA